MSTIYIGVDFHARQQTVCSLKTSEGVVSTHNLKHQDKNEVRAFLSAVQWARNRRDRSQWLQSLVRTNARRARSRSLAR
jgi:hypothetical protein